MLAEQKPVFSEMFCIFYILCLVQFCPLFNSFLLFLWALCWFHLNITLPDCCQIHQLPLSSFPRGLTVTLLWAVVPEDLWPNVTSHVFCSNGRGPTMSSGLKEGPWTRLPEFKSWLYHFGMVGKLLSPWTSICSSIKREIMALSVSYGEEH